MQQLRIPFKCITHENILWSCQCTFIDLPSQKRTSEYHHGSSRLVSTEEGAGVRCWWMCCAHLAGQGLALIPEPLGRGAPVCWSLPPCWLLQTTDLLSAQTHRPLLQENKPAHQHINCRALYARLVYETFIFHKPSLIFHTSILGEEFRCPVETYRLR